MALDIGSRLGVFEVTGRLGEGGMGVVYRARHKALGALVAVKLIRSSQLASREEVRRFYQEARFVARLRHPGIVPVFDLGEYQRPHPTRGRVAGRVRTVAAGRLFATGYANRLAVNEEGTLALIMFFRGRDSRTDISGTAK